VTRHVTLAGPRRRFLGRGEPQTVPAEALDRLPNRGTRIAYVYFTDSFSSTSSALPRGADFFVFQHFARTFATLKAASAARPDPSRDCCALQQTGA